MVKANFSKELNKTLSDYIKALHKHYKVDYIILFGSFASGNQGEDSDIDVAVVATDVNNSYYDRLQMMELRRNLDIRIEPHPINTADFIADANPFIQEIKNTGIQIYAA